MILMVTVVLLLYPTVERPLLSHMISCAPPTLLVFLLVVCFFFPFLFHRLANVIVFFPSDDIQDLQTSHASELWAKYINRHTGRRSDAATAYVHSVMDIQSNLYLRTNARVNRVIFEGDKAIGVAYVPARNRAHDGKLMETIVKARKMVVLSSGTLGTPQILERSGVGNHSILEKLGIKVVSDLPGVGEEYQDHYTTLSSQCILLFFSLWWLICLCSPLEYSLSRLKRIDDCR